MVHMKDKWDKLDHMGPLFPKPYTHKNLSVIVKGKKIDLTPAQEEMIWAWTAKLETPYVQDKTFQKNFFADLKVLFDKDVQNSKFPEDWDFKVVRASILEDKESKKAKTSIDRKKEKADRDTLKAVYGVAKLNGVDVDLGNYVVEPAGIFMGRGQHPKRGSWKSPVSPEDVTLNLSKGSTVPPAPEGHKWEAIVENKGALWTAMWRDSIIGAQKRVLFGVASFVRQGSDQKKFQKAINLAKNWDAVVAHVDKGLVARDKYTRKVATVCKLINVMSIRVGDEKDTDEAADTVGATSLRLEHVKVGSVEIEFDFLGKDSVRYHNKVQFDINTLRNVKEFCEGKAKTDLIFDGIDSSDVNQFFDQVLPGLTAKQFRTAYGSLLLAAALKAKDLDKTMKEGRKVEYFTEKNLEVAIKLNHQSAVSAAYDTSLDNMKATLASLKKELSTLKADLDKELTEAKKLRDSTIKAAKTKYTGDRQKASIKRAKDSYKKKEEAAAKKLTKTQDRYDSLSTKVGIKEKTRGVALGTSKLNYSDPRIVITWCKANNVDIKRIYPVTAQKKFSWAFNADENFYKDYPQVKD